LEVVRTGADETEMISALEEVAKLGLSRDELRQRKPPESNTQKSGSPRKRRRHRPYVFNFRPSDKSYKISMAFKKSEVEREDLIVALESVLAELRATKDPVS
jgi:hypothetical protein